MNHSSGKFRIVTYTHNLILGYLFIRTVNNSETGFELLAQAWKKKMIAKVDGTVPNQYTHILLMSSTRRH